MDHPIGRSQAARGMAPGRRFDPSTLDYAAMMADRARTLGRVDATNPAITRILAVPRVVDLGAGRWVVSELRLLDLADLQAWLEEQTPHPLAAIPPAWLDPVPSTRLDRLAAAWEAAASWPVRFGTEAASRLLNAPTGRAYFLALLIRRFDRGFGLGDALALEPAVAPGQWQALHRVAYGIGPREEIAAELAPDEGGSRTVDWIEAAARACGADGGPRWADLGELSLSQWRAICSGGKAVERSKEFAVASKRARARFEGRVEVADERDAIVVDLSSDISEGEKARQKLAEIQRQTEQLNSSFQSGNVQVKAYNAELRTLQSEAKRTQAALDAIHPPDAGRLTGTKRTSAQFQIGLAGANALQDAIQGGPASAVNNVLGLAGNNSARALGGEFVAAAGGAKVLVGAFATITAAAGAAFLTINTGLASNNLGWSDLGEVIDEMAGGAISSIGRGIGGAISEAWTATKGFVGTITDVTIGWNDAAQAVRAHKDEVDRNTEALAAYQKAQKAVDAFKSDAAKEGEERGKLFGQAAAGLEGGSLNDLIKQVALSEAKKRGDADKVFEVESNVLGKDGKPTGATTKERVTGAELTRRGIAQDFSNAMGGDFASQDALRKRIAAAGYDPTAIDAAMDGRDPKAEKKEAEKQAKEDARDRDKRTGELARPLQERFNNLSAEGGDKTPDRAGVVRQLTRAGVDPAEADAVADGVLRNLRDGYADAIRKHAADKGTDAKGAAADILGDAAEKRAREADQAEGKQEKARRDAGEKAERATGGTGLDKRVDDALLRSALRSGGAPGVASKEVAEGLARELKGRGLSDDEARVASEDIVRKHAERLGDQVNEKAMSPREYRGVQHMDGADFARSVEAAGFDAASKTADNTAKMADLLADLVRNSGRGPRLG